MDHFEIQVGKTDAFRVVGIQPPISEAQAAALADIALPEGMRQVTGALCVPDQGQPYTELGFSTIGVADADTAIRQVAGEVAAVLRSDTAEVTVDDREVFPVGSGRHLFGGRARRLG